MLSICYQYDIEPTCAFKDTQQLKETCMDRLRNSLARNELSSFLGQTNFLELMFEESDDRKCGELFGFDPQLLQMIDKIVCRLPENRRGEFLTSVFDAISVGADTSDIPQKFALKLLERDYREPNETSDYPREGNRFLHYWKRVIQAYRDYYDENVDDPSEQDIESLALQGQCLVEGYKHYYDLIYDWFKTYTGGSSRSEEHDRSFSVALSQGALPLVWARALLSTVDQPSVSYVVEAFFKRSEVFSFGDVFAHENLDFPVASTGREGQHDEFCNFVIEALVSLARESPVMEASC